MREKKYFYTVWIKRPIDEEPMLNEDCPIDISKKQAFAFAKSLLSEVNPKTVIYVRKIKVGSLECKQYEFKNKDNLNA